MPLNNITKLALPPEDFRPDLAELHHDGTARFETEEEKRVEDGLRIRLISRALQDGQLNYEERKMAKKLLYRLKRELEHPGSTDSLASSMRAREYRLRAIGWLRHIAYLESCKAGGGWSTFHILPPDWVFASDELWDVDPKKLTERIRRLFNAGGQMPTGWLFAGIHGEFVPGLDVFRLHLHGAASNSMLERLDHLRDKRPFRLNGGGQAAAPIQITRKKIEDPLRALNYCLQLWWPLKSSWDEETNEASRSHDRRRIPDPHHTRMLIWLDRQSLPDLTLRIGLRVSNGALRHD